MTKTELIEMVGSEDKANLAMEIILSQVNKKFVETVIKSRLTETENKIAELEEENIIYTVNGMKKVDWNPNNDSVKQYEANSLICTRNKLISMLAIR